MTATVVPMLAHPGTTEDLDRDRFVWSLKLDGVRCLAHFDGTTVTLINRRLVDITHRYPDVVMRLAAQLDVPCVLDGELVAYGEDGKPSFTLIAQRDQASRPSTITAGVVRVPVSYMAFDLLKLGAVDLRGEPLHARLADLAHVGRFGGRVQLVEHFAHGRTLWEVVKAQQLEGVVGKDRMSRYVGTRSRNWLKVKTLCRVSCVVTGYTPGEGARANTIGALHLHMFDGDQLVNVGRVGTGFNARSLAECKALLDAGQPFVAEVECLSLGSGRQLRHPSFKGIRRDLGPADCTVAQLDTLAGT